MSHTLHLSKILSQSKFFDNSLHNKLTKLYMFDVDVENSLHNKLTTVYIIDV